jgi:cysteine-rich repeat protein
MNRNIYLLSPLLFIGGCLILTNAFREQCGDGFLQADEECDDGNQDDTDSCDSECFLVDLCGNEVVDDGEECDIGQQNADDGECTSLCQNAACGDGFIQLGKEDCDDSNTNNNDGCSSECFFECGNGELNSGEQCDDGNRQDGDDCSSQCLSERCGDSVVDTVLGEQCDDGNINSGDGCELDCTFVCGAGNPDTLRTKRFNGSCYVGITTDNIDWLDAEDECEALGGYLVIITNLAENDLARTLLPISFGPWIGFNDLAFEAGAVATLFNDVKGDPLSFNNFRSGEPNDNGGSNEDCVQFGDQNSPQPDKWNDIGCQGPGNNFVSGFICEIEFVSCGDSVVQENGPIPEECDDGNNIDGDSCESDCQNPP